MRDLKTLQKTESHRGLELWMFIAIGDLKKYNNLKTLIFFCLAQDFEYHQ